MGHIVNWASKLTVTETNPPGWVGWDCGFGLSQSQVSWVSSQEHITSHTSQSQEYGDRMTQLTRESWLRLRLSQPSLSLVLANISSYVPQLPDPGPGKGDWGTDIARDILDCVEERPNQTWTGDWEMGR